MTVSQSGCAPVNSRMTLLRWVFRLSQITMTGAARVVRGGDQARVIGFGHAPALALAPPVDAQPVEEPARLTGLQAGQPRDGHASRALAGHADHGGTAAAAPGAGPRRPQRLAGLVLEADPRPGRRR